MKLRKVWGQRRGLGVKTDLEDGVTVERAGKDAEKEKGVAGEAESVRQKGEEGQDGDKKRVNDLDRAVEAFIKAILASEVYRTYLAELEKVKQDPELKREIDEFRWRNFDLQLSQDADYERLDHFEKEYENFRDQPLVADFLAAELDLCRKLQGISLRVIDALNFE